MPESHQMNGGDGPNSYYKNSNFQKTCIDLARSIIDDAIADKLDINKLLSSPSSSNKAIVRIADMGCSVGPNTLIAMKNIIEAVKGKYQSEGHHSSELPEFQVFFNDHVTNDFNTLFSSLSSERRPYFAAGVPGSFHDQLFPKSSLHIVHSSIALHWLSRLPEELLDVKSPAWNRGRVHYTNAPYEVYRAYGDQFAKDMAKFLDARAEELVVGGLMVLIMIAVPNGVPSSPSPPGLTCDLVGTCLMDMAKEGLISESQVDSFNLPMYLVSPKEMTEIIEANGSFSTERMELQKYVASNVEGKHNPKLVTMHTRATMEVVITKHFGSEIIDELFDRFYKKIEELSDWLVPKLKQGFQLSLVLKRK